MAAMNELPSVAVVIPSWNGKVHLPDCLNSLRAVDYPRDRLEVVVVDNGSTDGSLDLLAAHFPWTRVVPRSENLGFAAACNAGAAETTAECVAFLNNDMRVDPLWIRELVACYEPGAGYVCVGGVILDWEGERIDFANGWVNFHGHAGQDHFHVPVIKGVVKENRDLPFACGGSLLIGREIFLELGGFDPAYFAFFEDVDLGWRLWLTGHKVRLAAKARSFHRHHGTSSAIPTHQRNFLYERNALMTLIKNVDGEHLATVLTSALFLLVERAVLFGKSSREAFILGRPDQVETEVVDRSGLAGLHAVSDLLADLEGILERRRDVQRRRRRRDSEIFDLFTRPFAPICGSPSYLEASLKLRSALGLDRLFRRQRVTHAVLIGAGNSQRLAAIARKAAVMTRVTLVAPGRGDGVLQELLAESDLVILDGTTTEHDELIASRVVGLLGVDLDDGNRAWSDALMQRADFFLSSSEGAQHRSETMLRSTGRSLSDDPRAVLLLPDAGNQPGPLRNIVEEPWRWQRQRDETTEVAVPEDLQHLLRIWREHYRRGGLFKRWLRAVSARLPRRLERSIRSLLRRPGLSS
jgi:GT2 family glycosyltransferase